MKKPPEAYLPSKWELPEASAFQALERGEADPDQQKRALSFLLNDICKTYDQSYRPDSHETAFAEGRRFVGLELVKLLKVNINALRRKQNA